MSFVSYGFPLFVGGSLLLYYLLPKKHRWTVLLLSGWIFYALLGREYLPFLAFVTVVSYTAALVMEGMLKREKQRLGELDRELKKAYKQKSKRKRQWLLWAFALLELAVLAGCKYFKLFQNRTGGLLLPIGLSFYMFQALGYVIDVYRGKYPAQRHFFRFALFVSFFPQLLQGPISPYDMAAQSLYAGGATEGDKLKEGLLRSLWGYYKKLLIADRLAPAVAACFALSPAEGGTTALGMLLYAAQLYCDFTGGIDIALGVATLFGVKLRENFNAPYFSKNLAEYWTRWHMGMGAWFRDYVFYPLSVSKPLLKLGTALRKKHKTGFFTRLPLYISILVTWLLTGVWHGAGWNYTLWGLSNGVILILSQELQPLYEGFHSRFGWKGKPLYTAFEILRCFILLCILRLWDNFPSPAGSFEAFLSLFKGDNGYFLTVFDSFSQLIFIVCIALVPVCIVDYRKWKEKPLYPKGEGISWLLCCLLVLLVLCFGAYGQGYSAVDFIYGQF